jgi:hypothetical protein
LYFLICIYPHSARFWLHFTRLLRLHQTLFYFIDAHLSSHDLLVSMQSAAA